MKITEHMILRFAGEPEITATEARHIEQGLARALVGVPDVEPFTFAGVEHLHVFVHPCGTVVDADPAMKGIEGSIWSDIEAGQCDCENTAPWRRIYVLKSEA